VIIVCVCVCVCVCVDRRSKHEGAFKWHRRLGQKMTWTLTLW
jgi:hypothetical protein